MADQDEGRAQPLLDVDDESNLRHEGSIRDVPNTRTRWIHKRRLNRSSEEEYSNTQQPSPPQIAAGSMSSGDTSSEDFALIPEFYESVEALEYAGFTNDEANRIWEDWMAWPRDEHGHDRDGGPVPFEDMATGRVEFMPHVVSSDDALWFETMSDYGISQEMQSGIMASGYKPVRLMASLNYWVWDNVTARFDGLRAIARASQDRVRAARRQATRPSGASPSTSAAPQPERRVSHTSLAIAHPGISPLPASTPMLRANAPGMTVLWKGAYQSRIDPCFDANGVITSFDPMISSPRGDFNSLVSAFYFAADYEVAESYAAYAKRRNPMQAVVILRLEVPNSELESLTPPDKLHVWFPTPEFKKLVWTSRRGHGLRRELRQYADATLIIGHTCGKPNPVFENMDSPERINSRTMLRSPRSNAAVQYAFVGNNGVNFLNDIRPACSAHLCSWRHSVAVEATLDWMGL